MILRNERASIGDSGAPTKISFIGMPLPTNRPGTYYLAPPHLGAKPPCLENPGPTMFSVTTLLEIIANSDLRYGLEFDCNQEASRSKNPPPRYFKLLLAMVSRNYYLDRLK